MSHPNSSTGNSDNSNRPGNTDNTNRPANTDNSNRPGNSGPSDNPGNSHFRYPGHFSGRRWLRGRRPEGRIRNFPPGECICTRVDGLVVCHSCGFFTTGRVRHPCPVHHQVCCL